MADGRQILAELQATGFADSDLDYDAVMADLARGTPPTFALTKQRTTGIGTRVVSKRQLELADELVAIARAPYVAAAPRPEPPRLDWARIAEDLQRTTGRHLEVTLRWEVYADDAYWMCDLALDGVAIGSTMHRDQGDDPEESLASFADTLCDGWLHEEIWGGWPMCPRHPDRPMWAVVGDDDLAVWQCEADSSDEIVIGQLGR